jgi:tRNA(Ile)-lysidine synthase
MGPVPAVAAIRLAVRKALAGYTPGSLVLVACSGGADSIALACATAFVAPRMALRFGGVTVDHNLQAGSAAQAEKVVHFLRGLGFDPVEALSVDVAGHGGPEAAARVARYAALDAAAARLGAAAVLLGHTRDDQAETVLLGLARGSGARSLAGMPRHTGRYVRPFLDLPRATTSAAARAEGFEPWDDPHNTDPAYTRSRVRHAALPALAEALGPGIPEALARTAKMLRDDTEALDAWSAREFARLLEDRTECGPGCETVTVRRVAGEAAGGSDGSASGAVGPSGMATGDIPAGVAATGIATGSTPAGAAPTGMATGDIPTGAAPTGIPTGSTPTGATPTGPTRTGSGLTGFAGSAPDRAPTHTPDCDVSHSLDAAELAELPTAVRRRVIRLAALRAGCPGSDLAAVHIEAVDALITGWRGQGPLHLPGPVVVARRYGKLTFERSAARRREAAGATEPAQPGAEPEDPDRVPSARRAGLLMTA